MKTNPEGGMDVKALTSPWQRGWGAMFRRRLGEVVLLFAYPHAAPRLFHTFFCPPLRIIALGEQGETLYDQVVSSGQFVRLPSTRMVVETDPDHKLSTDILRGLVRAASTTQQAVGAWQADASLDRLLFVMLRESVADMRRVHEAHHRSGEVHPEVLQEKFALWERGQLFSSAGFLLDCATICEVPETAIQLSRQILAVEANCSDEIAAAAIGGVPWQGEFLAQCLRCGQTGSWRPVLGAPVWLEREAAWRYGRPENHVPLCRRCAAWLGWQERDSLRMDLAQGLWGMRSDAWWAWHSAASANQLPEDWDKSTHPLWPPEYGGNSWESGSGAFEHAEPQAPAGVRRSQAHRVALSRVLTGRGGIKGRRGRGHKTPWLCLLQIAEIPLSEVA